MSYQNEWLLFEAEDEFDEIKHREPTEELLFYRAVASGDIKTVKKNCERQRFTECDGVGVLSKNAVTNMKYHFVITTAMITRLCKQNGMEMEQAFRLSDFYIQKLDGIHTVEEVQSLHDEMVMDYTEKMRRYFRDNTYSKHINASKEYIYSHIKERITIEDLADSLGVSASYLSRLFKKETGKSFADAAIEKNRGEIQKKLTPIEWKIALAVAQGMENREIAEQMNYSYGYVKNVIARIFSKLEIERRRELRKLLIG